MRWAKGPWAAAILCLGAQTGIAQEPEPPQDPPADFWFPVGETLRFDVYWGVVPVAHSTATTEWIDRDGRRLLSIQFRTKSNKFLSKIYPVDDFLESIIDPVTFLPLEFTKRLNEGRYHCDELTVFDHAGGMAYWRSNLSDKKKEFAIESDTRDLISFMYKMRAEALTVGQNHSFQVMADEKIYDLSVKALKEEKVKLERYGPVASLKLEPTAAFQGLFVRKGKMIMWVSQDERRLMTQAKVDVPVANVHIRLVAVEGPGDDFWRQPKEPAKERGSARKQRSRN